MKKSNVFSIWVLISSNAIVKEMVRMRIIFSNKETLNKNIKTITNTAMRQKILKFSSLKANFNPEIAK
jgi:hypothetical protein